MKINIIKIKNRCESIKQILWLLLISVGVSAILYFAGNVKAVAGFDVSELEYRSVTVESWDKDFSGGGYGWEVKTDKDDAPKNEPYKVQYSNLQSEREVKLLKGTPAQVRENMNYADAKILGVKYAFTFPGENTVTIRPPHVDHFVVERPRPYLNEVALGADFKAPSCYKDPNYQSIYSSGNRAQMVDCIYGIPLPGIVKAISVWVCGRGNEYNLEGWVEDWTGRVHILKFGSVDFIGWKPMTVIVPVSIPQKQDVFPPTKNIIFKQFKLRSRPDTNQDTVYIFFDELRTLSKIFEVHFDGAQIDFDKADCERKNYLINLLRSNSRNPDSFGTVADCSQAPGPAAAGPAAPGP